MGYDIYTIKLRGLNGDTEFKMHMSGREAQVVRQIAAISLDVSDGTPYLDIKLDEKEKK